jgi:hypothetical protein
LTKHDEPRAAERHGAERGREILDRGAVAVEDLVRPEGGRAPDRLGLDLGEAAARQMGIADEEKRDRPAALSSSFRARAARSRRSAQKSSTMAL